MRSRALLFRLANYISRRRDNVVQCMCDFHWTDRHCDVHWDVVLDEPFYLGFVRASTHTAATFAHLGGGGRIFLSVDMEDPLSSPLSCPNVRVRSYRWMTFSATFILTLVRLEETSLFTARAGNISRVGLLRLTFPSLRARASSLYAVAGIRAVHHMESQALIQQSTGEVPVF